MVTAGSSDFLAREAARLLVEGEAVDAASALRVVAERFRGAPVTMPTAARVRQHLEAMLMQRLGAEGYAQRVARRMEVADELLSAVDAVTAGDPGYLVGRGAAGAAEPEGTIHLRVYTDLAARHIADQLRDLGCNDPHIRTAITPRGKIDELSFEEEGWPVVLRVCPPALERDVQRDLFTGRRIPVMKWTPGDGAGGGDSHA